MSEIKSEKTHGGVIRTLEIVVLVAAAVTGLVNTGMIFYRGGELMKTVAVHDDRLRRIEDRGSSLASEHVKVDDEREARSRERIARLEEFFALALAMRSDMARMSQKLDDLNEQIKRMNPK